MRVNPATGSIVFNVVYDGLVPATGNSIYAYPAPSAVGDATNTTGRGVVVVSAYGISTTASFCFPAAGQCNAVLWGASGADGSLQWTRNLTGQGWLARDVVADTQTPAVYFFVSGGSLSLVRPLRPSYANARLSLSLPPDPSVARSATLLTPCAPPRSPTLILLLPRAPGTDADEQRDGHLPGLHHGRGGGALDALYVDGPALPLARL